jgi:hypothetical protein
MQTKMNTFPALTKKGLPYPSGRRPIRVVREGARRSFHGGKHFGNAIHELQITQYKGGLGAIT